MFLWFWAPPCGPCAALNFLQTIFYDFSWLWRCSPLNMLQTYGVSLIFVHWVPSFARLKGANRISRSSLSWMQNCQWRIKNYSTRYLLYESSSSDPVPTPASVFLLRRHFFSSDKCFHTDLVRLKTWNCSFSGLNWRNCMRICASFTKLNSRQWKRSNNHMTSQLVPCQSTSCAHV